MNENIEPKTPQQKKLIPETRINKDWVMGYLRDLLDIRSGSDRKATIEDVKEGISMKGHTAWILVFSILIASIGLNVSSTAVVIGAMLISPLMGPILGIGLSIAINDIETLKKSLVNLAVMIGLSLLTSSLFFVIPLFDSETPELLARTKPDVRDVFIAIAGGLALIIALSRRSKQMNTIAGVAIATALMPPLCTAGFGIATGNIAYFGGAMFLFTINALFIALATFIVSKFLKFPVVKYINSVSRKRIARIISIVATVVFLGSIWLFIGLFREDQFRKSAQNLINDVKKSGISIIDEDKRNINYNQKTIRMVIYGNKLGDKVINHWNSQLESYKLKGTKLVFQQGIDDSDIRNEIQTLNDLYVQNQKIISSRDETIKEKDQKIKSLQKQLGLLQDNQIPFLQISKETLINYPELENLSFARQVRTDFTTVDTLLVFNVQWEQALRKEKQLDKEKQLKNWLKTRLVLDTLEIITISKK